MTTYQFIPGKHFARPFTIRRPHSKFTFKIGGDTYYDTLPPGCEGDWNKLGYYFSGLHPHIGNSVTLVWKWEDRGWGRRLFLGWYGWQESKSPTITRHWSKGVEIEPDKFYHVKFNFDGYVTITIDGVQWETTLKCRPWLMSGPYFGGQEVSPNSGKITINYT